MTLRAARWPTGRGELQDQVPVAGREGGACGLVRGLLVVFHGDHAPAGVPPAVGVAGLPRFSSSTAMSARSVSRYIRALTCTGTWQVYARYIKGPWQAVLLKIYAHCIDGQADAANQRITDALGVHDTPPESGDEGDDDIEQAS
jgi:hypothetical protein